MLKIEQLQEATLFMRRTDCQLVIIYFDGSTYMQQDGPMIGKLSVSRFPASALLWAGLTIRRLTIRVSQAGQRRASCSA